MHFYYTIYIFIYICNKLCYNNNNIIRIDTNIFKREKCTIDYSALNTLIFSLQQKIIEIIMQWGRIRYIQSKIIVVNIVSYNNIVF